MKKCSHRIVADLRTEIVLIARQPGRSQLTYKLQETTRDLPTFRWKQLQSVDYSGNYWKVYHLGAYIKA